MSDMYDGWPLQNNSFRCGESRLSDAEKLRKTLSEGRYLILRYVEHAAGFYMLRPPDRNRGSALPSAGNAYAQSRRCGEESTQQLAGLHMGKKPWKAREARESLSSDSCLLGRVVD
jgi:hypothetical protein